MVWGGNDNAVQRWIKQLEENDPSLTSLHILSMRRLSAQDLKKLFSALARNTTLQELYCSGHALDREAMEQLSEALTLNDTLRKLNVGDSMLGQQPELIQIFSEGLAVNEGLEELDLENKGLGHHTENLQYLGASLKKHSRLRSLHLARNNITEKGLACLLAAGLTTTLRELDLRYNEIGPIGVSSLVKHMAFLESLDVSENPLMEGAGVLTAALTNAPQLHALKMVAVTGASEQDEEKKPVPEHGNALVEGLIDGLKNQRALRYLYIDRNGIESSAMQSLGVALAGSNVVDLRMRDNEVGDDGAETLSKAITCLEKLELGGNRIGYRGFGALLDARIQHLGLFNNQINNFPEKLPSLQESTIVSLDIGCNHLTLSDMEAIVQVLSQQGVPKLTLLEMGGNAREEDKDAWESAITRLQSIRSELQVEWKRFFEREA